MIEVEIWSDFACPFCFIGKRHFEKALAQFDKRDQVKVSFRSFELDPSAAKSQKISIYELLAKKYGRSIEWAKQANQNVINMGKTVNIAFAVDKIIPTNSFDAHRLAHLAREVRLQSQWQEAVFEAYFTAGIDIADHAQLQSLALKVGLKAEEVTNVLTTSKFSENVREEENLAGELGISGVPFFVFNRKVGVSGAQPSEAFIEVLNELTES